jgi:hypothetical protein
MENSDYKKQPLFFYVNSDTKRKCIQCLNDVNISRNSRNNAGYLSCSKCNIIYYFDDVKELNDLNISNKRMKPLNDLWIC